MENSESDSLQSTFIALILIGFFARLSYGMARTPLLALFAKNLGASSAFIGLVVGMSTVTGIFFKAPSGTLSDLYGRRKIRAQQKRSGKKSLELVPCHYIGLLGLGILSAVQYAAETHAY